MVASAAGVQAFGVPLQPSGVVVFTSATLPPVAPIAIGVGSVSATPGSGSPDEPPEASWTSMY
jgi:hypothetical protein